MGKPPNGPFFAVANPGILRRVLESTATDLAVIRARMAQLARARFVTTLTPAERDEYERLGRREIVLLAMQRQLELAAS